MTLNRVCTTLLALVLALNLMSALDLGSNSVVAAEKPTARASHILVPTEAECDEILKQLEAADDLEATFARLAKERSKCPSSRKGGDLGSFGRGQMVPEFDKVVFERPVGDVHKVETQVRRVQCSIFSQKDTMRSVMTDFESMLQFGWHLVLTTGRSGMGDDALDDLDEEQDRDL
ncbi:unnamed protein product [Phytophthora fragariaefolia]|uniref:Peptidyl-prolyl cis-trans isomerase n=1 Tax=Phytophthora fragariaefolia TaxID=1490495 RepID=A0A9W6UF79_9STRA|nr:unnamed protein product [Phytophthora fragariaefolia]